MYVVNKLSFFDKKYEQTDLVEQSYYQMKMNL